MHSIHKSRLPAIPKALRLTNRQIKKRNVEYCRLAGLPRPCFTPTINLQSIGLPVFPTGAIVVVCTERENMISLVPDLLLGWGGITDPYFVKYLLRVCLSALPTIARCPPGSYGKLHGQFCLIHLTDHLLSFSAHSCPLGSIVA